MKKTAEEIAAATAYRHPLAEAYYKENADFFVTASPGDLPADLAWEDGWTSRTSGRRTR